MAVYTGQYTGPEIDRLLGRIDHMADEAEQIAEDTAESKLNEYSDALDSKVSAAASSASAAAESEQSAASSAEIAKSAIREPGVVSIISSVLTAGGWVNGEYSLESLYPSPEWNVEVQLDSANCNVAEVDAWIAGAIIGSSSGNTLKAFAVVPEIDIHVIIKAVHYDEL